MKISNYAVAMTLLRLPAAVFGVKASSRVVGTRHRAQQSKKKTSAKSGGDRPIDISLGERPEGITEGPGSELFVSQILSGSVVAIDVRDGSSRVVVPAQEGGRQAWGLWYYKGAIFVAGGGEVFGGGIPEVYVYDAKSGEALATCSPDSFNGFGTSFINDVTVRGGYAYITDSTNGSLMVMDADAALDGVCHVSSLDLPDAFHPLARDDFGANGVVSYADGLLVCDEIDGSVYYLNLKEETSQQIILDGVAAFADGLTVLDDKLYITQNLPNEIGVFALSGGYAGKEVLAEKLGSITSPLFATPATSAIYDGYIYSTNSRFASLDISEEANDNVIGVRNYFDETPCSKEKHA